MSETRRILVRAPSWLGDFCMAEPVYSAVDEACERWTIAAPSRFLELLENRYPNAERIETDREEGGVAAWREHAVSLHLNGSLRSVWTALRAGIPERVSWSSSLRGLFATCAPKPAREAGGVAVGCGTRGRFPRRLPRPFGSACIELAGLLGISVSRRVPQLQAAEADRESVSERLKKVGVEPDSGFTLVNLGGPPGGAKTPTDANWCARLASNTSALPRILVCGPGEEARVNSLAEFGIALVDPVVTLGELLALAELATQGLTPDSGPRHLLGATKLPMTVLFGPTDPRHTGENTRETTVLRGRSECAPCHLATCVLSGSEERKCHAPVLD